jgi:hypothetical protein
MNKVFTQDNREQMELNERAGCIMLFTT